MMKWVQLFLSVASVLGGLRMTSAGSSALSAYAVTGDAVSEPLGGLRGDAGRGETVIRDRRIGNCLVCHRLPLPDEAFQGDLGPDLAGIGSRLTAGQIRLRLIDESLLNPDTIMPPYYRITNLNNVAPEYAGAPGLTAQQLEDAVAYLASLK